MNPIEHLMFDLKKQVYAGLGVHELEVLVLTKWYHVTEDLFPPY